MAWRFILFVAAALAPIAAFAQHVPQSEWPATVLAEILEQDQYCRESGGLADYGGDFVWRADFNQDGKADYIVSTLGCNGENGFMFGMYGYNAGGPLSVHLSGPRGHILAWDGLALEVDQIFGPPDIVTISYRCESSGMRPDSFCNARLVYSKGRIVQKETPDGGTARQPEWKYDPSTNRATIALQARSDRVEQASLSCESGQPVLSFMYRAGLEPGERQLNAKMADADGSVRKLTFLREATTNTWTANPVDGAALALLTGRQSDVWIVEKTDADGNEQGLSLSLKGSTKAIKAVTAACGTGPSSNAMPVTGNAATWAVTREPMMARIQLAEGSLAEVAVACIATTPVMLVQYRDNVPAGPPLKLTVKSGSKEHVVAMTRAGESRNFVARPVAQDVLNLITSESGFLLSADGVALGNVPMNGARVAANEALALCQTATTNDDAQIRDVVMRIYDSYVGEPQGDSGLDMATIYTPGLMTQEKRAIAADPDVGIGFDPFCECQDFYDARYTINRSDGARYDGRGPGLVHKFWQNVCCQIAADKNHGGLADRRCHRLRGSKLSRRSEID